MKTGHSTDSVFGVSRDLPLNYVERSGIDDKFVSRLAQKHNIVIYGSSKQGKTSLRKKWLFENDYIVIASSNNWSIADLFSSLLKKAGYKTEQGESKTLSGSLKLKLSAKGQAGVPFLAEAKAGADVEGAGTASKTTNLKSIEIDPSDANDVIEALNSIGFSRYIVVEDFHYLPEETQRNFAFALKTFHEESEYSFVVVGVWREENRLIGFNGDLTERVHSIDVDRWSKSSLLEVIEAGEAMLNVSFDKDFQADLLSNSFDSVHLLQEACRRVASSEGVDYTLSEHRTIGKDYSAAEVVKDVVGDQRGRYMGFLQNVSEGFQETKKEMPKWVIYALLVTPLEDLEKGIRLGTISKAIRAKHPDGEKLNPGNLTQILQTFGSLQTKKNVRPIIVDYDTQNRALYVVDRGFIIWLANQDRGELLRELNLPETAAISAV
jgi:hypothetical protein